MNNLLKRILSAAKSYEFKRSIPLILFFMVVSAVCITSITQPAYAEDVRLTNGTASTFVLSTGAPITGSWLGPLGNMFDSDTSTQCGWPVGGVYTFSPMVIVYSLPSPEVVTSYRLIGNNLFTWELRGSNSSFGASDLLATGFICLLGVQMSISNTTAYSYYYLIINSVSCNECFYSITELEYYKSSTPTTPTTPATPTGPSTDVDGSYTISWNAVSGATSYQLQECYNGGSWSIIYNGSGTSKARTGRTNGTWGYRVRATNSSGSSSYSGVKAVVVGSSGATYFFEYDENGNLTDMTE